VCECVYDVCDVCVYVCVCVCVCACFILTCVCDECKNLSSP